MKTKYFILLGFIIISIFLIKNNDKKVIDKEIFQSFNDEIKEETETLYYGKTKQELIEQINKSLKSTLTGKGEVIVNYSLEYNVDPYLATAIMMHETGCRWGCSRLVEKCNNVAGQKGGPSCNGGAYKKYNTLDDGIKGAIYNIYINYVEYGLLTAEQMNPKYAEDPKWALKVNKYINEIKSN